jgi:hypothetical protein
MTGGRVIKARRTSTCPMCRRLVIVGDQIGHTAIGWCHTACLVDEALRRWLTTATVKKQP